jgi:hypothetical protein
MKKINLLKHLFIAFSAAFVSSSCEKNVPEYAGTIEELKAYENISDEINSGRTDSCAFIFTNDNGSIYYKNYNKVVIFNEKIIVDNGVSISKYNESDLLVWKFIYGNPDEFTQIGRMIQMDDGSILFRSKRRNVSELNYNNYVVKLSKDGALLWEKGYKELGNISICEISKTNDGGLILAGIVPDIDLMYDWIIVKTNFDGEVEWSKTFKEKSIDDIPRSIFQIEDNSFIVVVADNKGLHIPGYSNKNRLIKLDNIGNITNYSYLTTDYIFNADFTKSNADGYILSLITNPMVGMDMGNDIIYMLNVNSAGDILWTERHMPLIYRQIINLSIFKLLNTGYFVIAKEKAASYVFRFNNDGELIE